MFVLIDSAEVPFQHNTTAQQQTGARAIGEEPRTMSLEPALIVVLRFIEIGMVAAG